jgi:GT2 family glycosyltransferase
MTSASSPQTIDDGAAAAPRFTILLPTHNRADVLPLAIQSVLWQTERDFELLILGDGCTDGTARVVESFKDSRIRWFDLPKAPGIGYANRNAGLRHARGRYVAYQAHDDIWFPDHLERIGARLDESGADLVHSRYLAVDLFDRLLPSAFDIGVPGHVASIGRGQMALTMCSMAHTRASVDRHGPWDETMLSAGDAEFYYRIASGGEGRNVAFVPEPTALHFVAKWRATPRSRSRGRLAGRLLRSLYDRYLPDALRLAVEPGESQQQAAWRRLSANPDGQAAAIRHAVVQFHDALLWQGRSTPRLIGLSVGHAVGSALEAIWVAALWAGSKNQRRWMGGLRERTRALDKARTRAGLPDASRPSVQAAAHSTDARQA